MPWELYWGGKTSIICYKLAYYEMTHHSRNYVPWRTIFNSVAWSMKGTILKPEGHSKNQIIYLNVLPSWTKDCYHYYCYRIFGFPEGWFLRVWVSKRRQIALMARTMAMGYLCVEPQSIRRLLHLSIAGMKLDADVAGATFMAAGSSAPELATSVIGVFIAKVSISPHL